MRLYRYGTQDSQAIASDGLLNPSGNLPATTTALNDNAPSDTATGIPFSDDTFSPVRQARARIVVACSDDRPSITFKDYTFRCAVGAGTQSGGGADKDAHAEVWAYDGATWTQVRQHGLTQDDVSRQFTGNVPAGTKKVGLVIDSNIVANTSGSIPNFQGAGATLTDFRLTEVCAPPPVPTLAGQTLLIDNQPAHRLVVN